ncbi:MAG TPA: PBP1A family penicillin-binding protein [Terriglobales bacterium]|nr:PBP1A family penicillin-binding protein [Terriglobales bacterium]
MALYSDLPPISVGGRKYVGRVLFAFLVVAAAAIGAIGGLLVVYTTDLPQVTQLERYRPSSVTELYDDQGRVIGSFALQRRVIAAYEDFPKSLRDAVISTEDKDFEKHWGINFWRVLGAAYRDLVAGSRAQGASTLTMQLSRNLFLSADRTYGRKIQEIMLAIQIERRFTKPQIFTLYANQIFLGHGVYGFEAGAQYYFNKPARQLALEEAAVLAALPKAPNYYSPINNPERCVRRRNLVLDNMVEDGKITKEEGERAKRAPLKLNLQSGNNWLAPYFVEEIRRYLERKYGSDEVHTGGLRVYTSLNRDLQATANQAVLDGVAAYERRHGWKGRLKNVIAMGNTLDGYSDPDWDQPIGPNSYVHALVTAASDKSATLKLGRYTASITTAEMKWTGRKRPVEILSAGDIAYVKVLSLADTVAKVQLEQDSGAQGALLAIDNSTGDIKAMVGGRDFDESKFNRSTQALRQVGSSFKPYVYTALIDNGGSPDDVVLDAPITFQTASGPYTPHNYDGKFEGNITVRRAIAFSRNIPALKLEQKVGVEKVIEYARRFGITSPLPPVIPLALGAADITLYEQTAAFSTFPNDGVRVTPRYIRKVTDYEGRVLEESYTEVKDVISAQTARVMVSLLQGVVQHGTAYAASTLKHPLAGKTGTTNDFTDAWFIGFSPSITCGVWLGFDEKKTLGNKETGALAALPIWMQFMKAAIAGHEKEDFAAPPEIPRGMALKLDTPDVAPGDREGH